MKISQHDRKSALGDISDSHLLLRQLLQYGVLERSLVQKFFAVQKTELKHGYLI